MDMGTNAVEVSSIPATILKQKINSNLVPILLDVREKKELDGSLGHLKGIIHIPITELSHRLTEIEPYKDQDMVTVCRSGSRAHTAAQILSMAGFKKVTVLEGGMIAWNRLKQ
jgi:rhodanese-related sulfurtransferase